MTEALGFCDGNAKGTEEMNHIDATSRKVIVAKTIHDWPAGYHTKTYWKYECDRRIRNGAKPTIVEIEERQIPVFHYSQTYVSMRKRTELQQAQHERGNAVPWLSEGLMVQHLRGESVYGLFAQESYPRRPARTYWVAADLDLHLATGGNLELFREQVRIILRHLWGRFGSQVVISEAVANGLHIYLFFKRPRDLDRARDAMRNTLQRIQRAYPELERQIDAWNETLRRAGKTWK